MLGITDRREITVSVHFVGRSQAAEQLVLSLSSTASLPMKGFPASRRYMRPGTRTKYSGHLPGQREDYVSAGFAAPSGAISVTAIRLAAFT